MTEDDQPKAPKNSRSRPRANSTSRARSSSAAKRFGSTAGRCSPEEGPWQPISVALTVLNEAAGVGALLEDLLAQDYSPDEIIVVDGGSADETVTAVQRYIHESEQPESAAGGAGFAVRLVIEPGCNISQGRNRAIALARNDVVAVTDCGVRLGADWLRLITAPLRQPEDGRGAEVVCGFFRPDPHSLFETAMGATVLPAVEDVDPSTFLPSSRSVAFRKGAWQRVGGYPEWLDYCEDVIFDLRLRAAGVPFVFEPRAVAHFRPRPNLRAFFRQYYRYARGDGKANLWPKRHLVRYSAYAFLLSAIRHKLLEPRTAPGAFLFRIIDMAVLTGIVAYLWKPLRRLRRLAPTASGWQMAAMVGLLPLIRLTGDVAKMCGYPAGWWWRVRRSAGNNRGLKDDI